MFNFFKKQPQVMLAPLSGRAIPLAEVPDVVFAQKTVGDGAAIADVTGEIVCAPVAGKLSLIFRTNHAFAVSTKEGMEVLVHVGMDTVQLNGQGFERLVEEGEEVQAGQPVLRIQPEVITAAGYSLVTPVVITTMDAVKSIELTKNTAVTAGKDVLFSYHTK